MRRGVIWVFLVAELWIAGINDLQAQTPPVVDLDQAKIAFALPIIELNGDGGEIGAEHGRRLASTIQLLHEKYLKVYLRTEARRLAAMMAAKAFETRLLPEHREEIQALAAQSGVDTREVMLAQCFLDLSAMTACSTISLPASASPDGVARFGRNLDFPSFSVADKHTVVFIYRPRGRYQFAAIGWPGMIGVLSGMNEHGLTVANMEVDRLPRLPVAMPYTLLYRTLLEQCRTVDEAIQLLEKTPRQTANNLMVMDAGGARAVIEITPEAISVRRGNDSAALISTNHQRGIDVDTPNRCRRYDYLHDTSASNFGRIDQSGIQSMLGGVAQGKMTLQSMIFEPANRIIHLSAGENAAGKTFSRLDLKRYFE